MRRVAIYLRVSTESRRLTTSGANWMRFAERLGWKVVKIYEDAGISGAKGRDQRPGFDALMKGVNS